MLTVEKEDPVMVTEAIIDDNRNNEMHSCLELDDDRNEMMPFSLELNDSNEKMHSCPEEMEGITSPLEVMNTNDQPTDQLKEEIQEVFIGSPIDNTRLEPLNAASREMHNKVVKDIGLKCLPSDSPEDHKHASNSPRDTPCDLNILPPCLTTSEVQRTFSSTPFPPDPQSTSVPNAPRPVTCLLDTFSASGENPESVLKETSLDDLVEMPTEDTDEEDSQKNIQNMSKRRPSNTNLYSIFSSVSSSAVMDKKELVDREIGMDDVSMSTAVEDEVFNTCTADAAIKVKCSPGLDAVEIEDLFRPFAGKVEVSPKVTENEVTCGPDEKVTENFFSLELSTSKDECSSGPDTITGDDEVKDIDASVSNTNAVYVEGSSSSDEITCEDVSLGDSKELNLYVHMSYK